MNGSVAQLTLNRPDAGNAITLEMARALVRAAIRCDFDVNIRCVVLAGAGRMFCAGGDISVFGSEAQRAPAFLSELAGTLHMALSRLARMAKPLLVLVNGPAAGAGLSLALMGDVVLASHSSHFTAAYGSVGLTPDGGLSWWLPRIIGLRKAQEMIMTNRRVVASEAERIGLITRMVDDSSLAEEGAAISAQLDSSATAALGASRALLLDSFSSGLEVQLERESRAISSAGAGSEFREGMGAFLEKRKANFRGENL